MSSAELEPHTNVVRQSRSCDGLNVTGELLTFDPDTAEQKPAAKAATSMHTWVLHTNTTKVIHTHSDVAFSMSTMTVCP